MDFSLNEDHLALRDAVQRFCDNEFPAQNRGNVATAAETVQRRKAMAELGVLGLPLASEHGGSGQGAVETMLVAQALGQALSDWTFVGSTVMAGHLLSRLGTPAQQARWIPSLCNGTDTAAVALYESSNRYDWRKGTTHATPTGNGWVLNGHKTLVLGGDDASLLLVLARTAVTATGANHSDPQGELAVFAIAADTPGIQIQGFATLDNRRAAHLLLQDVKVDASCRLGATDPADSTTVNNAIEAMLDSACAALCAEAAGAVEALLIHTADHLRTRKQFGAPLAKFQVLQHRVADMAIALEHLKSMACAAAMAVQTDNTAQRRRLVSAAKVLAGQQGRLQGLAAIQLHGAVGMTDECRVGHYAKRLMVIGQLFGDAAWHLQQLHNHPV